MRTASRLISLILLLAAATSPAVAQTCTQDQFRKIVDDAGSELRRLHAETQPAVLAGFRRLKTMNGWSDDSYEEKSNALLNDAKTESYDAKVVELLSKLDQLAEGNPGSAPDCSRLGELEATALELQATVRVKTRHMLARIDELTGAGRKTAAADPAATSGATGSVATAAPSQPGVPAAATPPNAAKLPDPFAPKATPQPPAAKTVAKPPASVPVAPQQKPAPVAGWNTRTDNSQLNSAPPASENIPTASVQQPVPMPSMPPQSDGFSADDIRNASRGFFGTLSAGLGNVIEHAFGTFGKPTGYVLGNEGGGAFIAGVRYGKGTLFTRGGKSREVFWHGPSIGYDFGAAGSKTMFLVYGMQDDLDIFTGFSGVDGSAYLVGGVGMTVLTNGKMLLAPIRSGVGLRLGASIGYVRFTAQPTWNPF